MKTIKLLSITYLKWFDESFQKGGLAHLWFVQSAAVLGLCFFVGCILFLFQDLNRNDWLIVRTTQLTIMFAIVTLPCLVSRAASIIYKVLSEVKE